LHIKDRNTPVVDLQWDRLSELYLLVAYETYISLWDVEASYEVHVFDKQNIAITAIAWLDWTPGNFVSTNAKNNFVKVWNASQKSPLESIKINQQPNNKDLIVSLNTKNNNNNNNNLLNSSYSNSTSLASSTMQVGINAIYFSTGNKRMLTAYNDGSISIYNMQRRQIEFKTSAGHTETIFDTKFSTCSPDVFATASYDGTLKIWHSSDFSLKKTIFCTTDIIYSCDWSPSGNMLASACSNGVVSIHDVDTGKELSKLLHHAKACYFVAWNKLDHFLLASTAADNTLVVFAFDKIGPVAFFLHDCQVKNKYLSTRIPIF
jgi:WD40 repeat protein